ncbi:SRPBCC domain-containing protein [Kribbella sp. NPDC056861]|uniref:SRPBCC domain-containing protein n=1 Tax=Kribbella sp. NPDC056861 TaxID=3154857 RepID=UPI003415DE79
MEFEKIEREIYVDASPEVAFEVVSSAEHISEWWSDDATFEAAPGAVGELVWGDRVDVVPLVVVEVERPRLFSFRWAHAGGDVESGEALLVSFELTPSGAGTTVRMRETGFREMGWEAAKLEAQYRDHVAGWDHHLAVLGEYAARVVVAVR